MNIYLIICHLDSHQNVSYLLLFLVSFEWLLCSLILKQKVAVSSFRSFCARRISIHQSLNFCHLPTHEKFDLNEIFRFASSKMSCFDEVIFLFFIQFFATSRLCILNNGIFICFNQRMASFSLLFSKNSLACLKLSFYLVTAAMSCWYSHSFDFCFGIVLLSLFCLHFEYLM